VDLPAGRLALRLSREERRLVDIEDVYYLEADKGGTLVRLRGARTLRDVRRLPALLAVEGAVG